MFSDKKTENKSQIATKRFFLGTSEGKSTFQFVDNRQDVIAQRKLQDIAKNSPQVKQLRIFQTMLDNYVSQNIQKKQSLEKGTLKGKQVLIQNKENKTVPTLQLKKVKVDVTGITHSVHPLQEEERSIRNELLISSKKHFLYNEVRELSEPGKIWIETEDVILSRRGPNQEIFYNEDLSGPKYYAWYGILDGTIRPGGRTNEYLREDTFELPENQIPGKKGGLTLKSDVNSLRLGAEALIAKHYPIPMSRTSLGMVFLDSPDAYRKFAIRYFVATAKEVYNEVTHKDIVDDIAKTNALTELDEIHINVSKADFGTFIHELIHFYGRQDEFIREVCGGKSDGFNEGVTEFFARKVALAEGIDRAGKYSKEVSIVTAMVDKIGERALYEAYFLGRNHILIGLLQKNGLWPVNK